MAVKTSTDEDHLRFESYNFGEYSVREALSECVAIVALLESNVVSTAIAACLATLRKEIITVSMDRQEQCFRVVVQDILCSVTCTTDTIKNKHRATRQLRR